MTQVLSSIWTLGLVLFASLTLFQTVVGGVWIHLGALSDLSENAMQKTRTQLTASSASSSEVVNGTQVTLMVENTGEVTIASPAEMDVVIQYTKADGSRATERLTFESAFTACNPLDGKWCLPSTSPNASDPTLWDPGETATIKLRVSPPIKLGTVATVVMAAPNGNTMAASFSA